MRTKPQTGIGYKALLLLVDLGLAYLALWAALSIRYSGVTTLEALLQHAQPFTIVYLIWIALFYFNGLYNFARIRDQINVRFDLIRTLLMGTMIAVVVFYLLPSSDLTPKRLLLMNAGIFALLIATWRVGFVKIFSRWLPRNNVAIVGINQHSSELAKSMINSKSSGYRLVALVGSGQQKPNVSSDLEKITIIDNPYELAAHMGKNRINTIVLAEPNPSQNLIEHLFEYLPWGAKFYNFSDFYEEHSHKVPAGYINYDWFLENINKNDRVSFDIAKRIVDIITAIVLLVIFSPISVIVALAIKIDDMKEPFIFAQKRIGLNNKIFLAYKFKTMTPDTPDRGNLQEAQENDYRLTRIGGFLRKTRLNEIPQLFNVLVGDMSLVGPRPERPEALDELVAKVPFYQVRYLIKPGLTGWAQVRGPIGCSVEATKEKVKYDFYYMKHRSLSLDLSVLIRTVLVALNLEGK